MVVGWPIASALGGRLLPRTGFRAPIRGGLLLTALAAAAIAFCLRPGVSLAVPRALTAAFGVGLGFANTPLVIAVQSAVPWNRRGVATASTMFFRTIGGTLSVGILGGVLASMLLGSGATPLEVDRLLGAERAALSPEALQGVSAALAAALSRIFWILCAIAFGAFGVSLAFPALHVPARDEGAGAAGGR
jgi:MFS family permease